MGHGNVHDDVIKWKHFPRHWPFVRGNHRSPVNSPHKGQWRGASMFFLICTRIHGRVNNGEAGDLRRHRTDNKVTVMSFWRNCRQSYEISVLAVPELPVQPVTECNKTYIFLVLSVTMHTISLWKYIYAHMVMFARGFLKRQTAKLRPPVRHCQIDSRSFPIYNILSFGMVVVDLFPHYKL